MPHGIQFLYIYHSFSVIHSKIPKIFGPRRSFIFVINRRWFQSILNFSAVPKGVNINNVILCFIAVKFGRMSKKQREKVEDEVRFHRAQMRAQSDAAPDSSVFDQQTPSSSDQFHHYNG